MCGIAGFIARNRRQDSSETLHNMLKVISYRGPDDAGIYEATTQNDLYNVALGHRRLSIIDLSTGHQPIGNEDGSVQVVFNGEIYNFNELRRELTLLGHRFATTSDTEVIVHAYEEFGEECVERFRGMFAFALWDEKQQKLFIARDRFGKKPLFISEANGVLLFASEIKSILAYPGVTVDVNQKAIWDYFAYRYVPGPATLFNGIRKLPPGCYAVWKGGKLYERSYYQPPDRNPILSSYSLADPVGVFLEKLDEAVRIRMVSDVPFGAFLSGGIDSSAIVALMARHSTLPIKTFSVGFAEKEYSENEYARIIAQQFSTDHHELIVSPDHMMSELSMLVKHRDAPVSEPADIPIFLLSKEARKTVRMVLTGEGSDEFLGGYNKHQFERYVASYQRIPRWLRHALIEPLINALPYKFRRIKIAVNNMSMENSVERYPHWFGALSHRERQNLVKQRADVGSGMPNSGVQFDTPHTNSALRKILYFDQTSWLPDNLLERGDRMTMAASIEARMPFMDHELVAFISTLPDRYRVKKMILKEAMMHLLPTRILERPKVGFQMPVADWFRTSMREYLHEHLLGSDSKTKEYYSRAVMEQILKEHMQKSHNHEKLLWSLLNLEIWHRSYV